uniref:Uncharacterized protein n=1 Tax=Schistocephalus solidus TaxID=70667 RepID=A0A0X3PGR4_SCHSO
MVILIRIIRTIYQQVPKATEYTNLERAIARVVSNPTSPTGPRPSNRTARTLIACFTNDLPLPPRNYLRASTSIVRPRAQETEDFLTTRSASRNSLADSGYAVNFNTQQYSNSLCEHLLTAITTPPPCDKTQKEKPASSNTTAPPCNKSRHKKHATSRRHRALHKLFKSTEALAKLESVW